MPDWIDRYWFFLGIALVGSSWLYAVLAVLFVTAHISHGLFALRVLGA